MTPEEIKALTAEDPYDLTQQCLAERERRARLEAAPVALAEQIERFREDGGDADALLISRIPGGGDDNGAV